MSLTENRKHMDNKNKFSNWDKYVYTVIMCLIHTSTGICNSTFFPALVDLKYIFNTTLNRISLISSFMTFGYIIGSLFGFLYKYINRQITLIILWILMGITAILIPYSESLWNIYLLFLIYGVAFGAWNTANTVWLIEIWQQNSASVLQLSQFMYGIGCILGPLIDRPYLTGERKFNVNQTDSLYSNSSQTMNTFIDDNSERREKLKTPFLISGNIQMIGPILMTIMFLVKRYRTPSEKKRENDDKSQTKLFDRKESSRALMITLFSLFYTFLILPEITYIEFGPTYFQYIPLKLSAKLSAEISSAMALTYTMGRGICIFMAIKIKPQYMIVYHSLIIIISTVILILGQNSLTLIWTGSLMMSFGFSALFPATFAFIGQYLQITDRIGTILVICPSSFILLVPFILGTFIEKHPVVYIIFIVTNLFLGIVLLGLILFIIRMTEKMLNNLNNYNEIDLRNLDKN